MCRRMKSLQVVVGSAPAQARSHAGAGYCRPSGQTPDVPSWPMLLPSGHNPSRSSREPSAPPDPRSRDQCAAGRAIGAFCSHRISQPPVGDTRREWYRVWRGRATGCRPLRPKRLPISARVARSPSESRQPGCRRIFKMRFSAARYSFCSRSSWLTNPVT